MIYKEELRDLFEVGDEYYLAHCISADFKMGKGIAVEFNARFDMKYKLQKRHPGYFENFCRLQRTYGCIVEGRVFNLITKQRYFFKPTYESMRGAIEDMKLIACHNGINKIAMPLIGCGLDKLKWSEVSKIIKEVFADTDIEILVCWR